MISLVYNNDDQRGDFVRTGGGNLDTDEGLETAVTISLLSDARANDSDDIDPDADKAGWWGEQFLDPPGPLGSRLYLLKRSKLTNESLLLAESYVKDALQWMVTARIASKVSAVAARMPGRKDAALVTVGIQRPSKTAPRFERVWEVQFGR